MSEDPVRLAATGAAPLSMKAIGIQPHPFHYKKASQFPQL